jgi:xanthine dehydrogenase small subunit
MAEGIRFLLGEETVEVLSFDPQLTVLEWLRNEARRKGSKEGCAEGDCGACTVVLGELRDGTISYRAFNACILLLATLDGKQLITVEDLAVDGLHPVQQAMVDQHGSQCGFCTPGFVMSLFAMYHDQDRAEQSARQAIDEGLAGNLCRCTGYVPIVKAARQALGQPASDHFVRHRELTIRALEKIQPVTATHVEWEGRHFFSPRSLSELSRLLVEYPEAVMVAGATDVGLWITKQLRCMDVLVHTGHVMELQKLAVDPIRERLEIGAAVSYSNAMDILGETYPDFMPMLSRLGAVQVRNAGTIGGNIANGSPIGDMPPPLIALQARLVLRSSSGRRELDLEDYFVAYGKQDLRPGEFIEKVLLPLPGEGRVFRVYKLSKRFDQDISSVCAAFAMTLWDDEVTEIRICYGGMAGIPARARGAERALLGQKWTLENIEQAKSAMADDFQPISDWRAGSEYRMLAAQNLLQRFFLETTIEETVQLATGTRTQ